MSGWPLPPADLSADRSAALVFRLALDLPPARLAALAEHLPPDEQARAARFLREEHRRRFTAAHGQMRAVLAALLGAEPAGLRFSTGSHGKPALEPPHAALRFNLSHSGAWALLAVIQGREIGVDVEAERGTVDYAALARRFFAPAEVQALLALPAAEQPAAFTACWTRKEAYIKARGLGLAIPLDSFIVTLAPGQPARLIEPPAGWSLRALSPAPGYAGALCVEGAPVPARCYSWSDPGIESSDMPS